MIDRSTLDQRLAALEADVPALMADRNAFSEAFEERAEQLVHELDAAADKQKAASLRLFGACMPLEAATIKPTQLPPAAAP